MKLLRTGVTSSFLFLLLSSTAFAQLQDYTPEYRETCKRARVKHIEEVAYKFTNGKRENTSTLLATTDWDAYHTVQHSRLYIDGQLQSEYDIRWTDSTQTINFTRALSNDHYITQMVYSRDSLHRVVRQTYSDQQGELESTDLFLLDSLGRLLKRIELSSTGDSTLTKEISYHKDTAFVALIAGDIRIRSLEVQDNDGNALIKASLDDQGNIQSQLRSNFSNGLFKEATSTDEHDKPLQFYELKYTFY